MANSQTKITTGSGVSSPLFSGDLRVAASVDSFMSMFGTTISSLLSAAAADATRVLQSAAASEPEWLTYAPEMKVVYTGDEFEFRLSGTDEELQHMRELEHGGPDHPPVPVVRSAAVDSVSKINKRLQISMDIT